MLFKDTDSLVYEIETNDVYEDFFMNKDMFYFSEHPNNSIFYDIKNKKDETKGVPFVEFPVSKLRYIDA